MTRNELSQAERPQGLMADLDFVTRPVRRLPNRRALAVLEQMYAYHDVEQPVGAAETAYDAAA